MTKPKTKLTERHIVIGQECSWNTKRRAKKDRKPQHDENKRLTIRQVWRGDKMAQVRGLDGKTKTVRFDFLLKNYWVEKPGLTID